jgi:Putative Ig domain
VNAPAIARSVTTVSPLPTATVGTGYSNTLTATGTTPITFTVASGSTLPAGLTLGSSTGVLGGTPRAAGVFTFAVTATNAGGSNSAQLSLTVNAPMIPPSITIVSPLPTATIGNVYSQTLTATGTTPITFTIASGSTLPAGLTLGSSAGVLGGTPTAAGVFTFTVTATNAGGSNSAQLSLTVNATGSVLLTPPSVSLLPSQSQTFTAKVGGTSSNGVTWSLNPNLGTIRD